MPEDLAFENREGYVYARYTGPLTSASLTEAARKGNDYLASHGYDAVLVDVTESPGEMGTIERFLQGNAMSEFTNKNFKIAVLARPDQTSNRFWENVTRNRMLKTKDFTDPEEAEAWLLSARA